MSWIDGITQAAYSWVNQKIQAFIPGGSNNSYTNPADDEEDNESEYEWVSTVVFGTPLRETKCLFVPEMNDFYSDADLNTVYHSAEEYRNAVTKYGLIYKSQKFSNASTTSELLDYAKDWIKNNYHGGIINFNVTALDLHITDSELQKFTVGRRVNVEYMDPILKTETSQTLTIISAEYDLLNPDKNSYKIGIPDVTLNKVYGETSKSGSGGGGGKNTSDEEDNETNTAVDQLIDNAEADASQKMEMIWAMLFKGTKNGDENYQLGDQLTPSSKDPVSDWMYGLMADIMKSSNLESVKGKINSLTSGQVKVSGMVDTDTVSANKGNVTELNSETLDISDTADIKTLKIDGKSFKPSVRDGKIKLMIDGTTYTITPD